MRISRRDLVSDLVVDAAAGETIDFGVLSTMLIVRLARGWDSEATKRFGDHGWHTQYDSWPRVFGFGWPILLGAFHRKGIPDFVDGDANDGPGKGPRAVKSCCVRHIDRNSGGRIKGCGQRSSYGATWMALRLFCGGRVGERFCVRNPARSRRSWTGDHG